MSLPEPAPPPARPWGWMATFALLAAAVLFYSPPSLELPQEDAGEPAAPRAVSARGYEQIVTKIFARNNFLSANLPGAGGDPVVFVRRDVLRKYPQINRFYRQSFLEEDVRSNDPSIWVFDGASVAGISPSAHTIALPFAKPATWDGDFEFRNGREERLTVAFGNHGYLLEPGRVGQLQSAVAPTIVSLFQSRTRGGSPVDQPARVLVLDGGQGEIGRIFQVGDALLFRLSSAGVAVRIDGNQFSVGDGEAAYARLSPGARVVITDSRSQRTAMLVRRGGSTISQKQMLTERVRNEQTRSLAVALEEAMNVAVQNQAAVTATNIGSTLDAALNGRLQSRLEAYCLPHVSGGGGRPFRAAITVMDISNGDLLALATFPRVQAHLGAARAYDPAARWLKVNQNFARMSIGSTAKVPFAAALLDAEPRLAGLQIPGGYAAHDMDELFGVRLAPPMEEHGVSQDPIDFTRFIASSSNRYAAMLMLLGASADPMADGTIPARGTYTLGGPRNRLPTLVFDYDPSELATGVPVTLRSPGNVSGALRRALPDDHPAWPDRLGDLFDIPLYEAVAPSRGGRRGGNLRGGALYDLNIWNPLISNWTQRQQGGFRTTAASPERERFGLNVINNFRTDYLNLIIGGGRSQWTTVKLAEAYARIVTDSRVQARLVRRVGRTEYASDPKPLGLGSTARQALLAGMQEVAVTGTAKSPVMTAALQRLQRMGTERGETVRLYSKSGTPTLATWSPTPAGGAIEDLYREGFLRLAADRRLGLSRNDGVMAPTDSASRAAVAVGLQQSARIRTMLAERRTTPKAVAGYLANYNTARTPAEQSRWLAWSGGQPFARQTEDTQGTSNGRLFVFVLTRERGGQPLKGISVAINVQKSWPTTSPDNVATQLGITLLRGDLDDALWLDAPPSPVMGAVHAP